MLIRRQRPEAALPSPEEQKRLIRNEMARMRHRWRDPGPRHYPAYRDGMTTKQYVQFYLIGNQTGAAPFRPSEINCKA